MEVWTCVGPRPDGKLDSYATWEKKGEMGGMEWMMDACMS